MSEGGDHVGYPFLSACGEAAQLIASFDWASTPLGPIASWPQSIKTTISLVLSSPIPIVTLWGEDGVMIYNDAYSVFAGGRHPELFGSKVREGWPEVADFNDNIMKVGLSGGTLAYRDQELTLYRNGEPEQVWMNLDYSPIPNEHGKPIGVIAIVVETTRRVLAERRLEGGRETLRHMFEQAPGFIAVLTGPQHSFVMANAAFLQLIGRLDILGKTVQEALPEVIGQGFQELLDRVYETREPYVGRSIRVYLDQRPSTAPRELFLDFIFQPIVAENNAMLGIFVQGHDVTEQKRTENALRESEERFRLVAESAPVMLWMGDATGQCIYLNEALRKFWGVTIDEVSHFDWATTVHDEDRDALYVPFSVAMENHTPFSVEVRFRRTDGEYRIIRTNAQPRFGPNGEFSGMIGVNVDETETRRAEEALQAINSTLEQRVAQEVAERLMAEEALRQAQKMESIGKLTGGVAHDFNNLLQVISGNLQLLSKDITGNERAERRVANALAGVGRGSKLASQLLAFGRRQALEPKVVNMGRLVSGMGDMLRRTIGEGVEVETVVSGGLWNTLIDPGQLENALLNLAINARDAMNESGRMTIEVGNAFLDDNYVLDHPEVTRGQYVVLAVTDTGGGIPSDVLPQVFEPFFSTKPQGKGTGLGLSMVYGFVKQSGGHIKIYSEVGHGTTVKVYLPRVNENEDIAAIHEASPPSGGTETILVAEDDDAVRTTVVEILHDLGYRVLTAKDAASALTVIESGVPVDLLFTDVVMPGSLKSPELAQKARERLPGIGVLFTSGYTENSIVHGGRLDAGVELLSKPYTREALARKIRQVLAKAPPRTASADVKASTRTETAAPRLSELTALLCEDDVLIRMGTADMLREFGLTVIETDNGLEALQIIHGGGVDILITDVGLPDMSGVELALKTRETFANIPVIFATGQNDVTGADSLPHCAIVPKPYDIGELKRGIESLVTRDRHPRRAG